MCEHLQSLRAASVQFGSVLRAGAERVVSPEAGSCTAEADADAGSVWSCADADADADADAAIGSASSSSERVTPHTDEHRC